jgi:nucleotide-binding universal stress UspA family protein
MVPQFNKILFATDLSKGAGTALAHAESIANAYGGHVTVLHVVLDVVDELAAGPGYELISNFGVGKWESMVRERLGRADERIREHLDEWCRSLDLDERSCAIGKADIQVEVGKPVEVIVDRAEKGGYDLIILGSHGQGAWADLILGSVAHGVLKRSTKPVLMVRVPVDDSLS